LSGISGSTSRASCLALAFEVLFEIVQDSRPAPPLLLRRVFVFGLEGFDYPDAVFACGELDPELPVVPR
jgi:hypothetical protein